MKHCLYFILLISLTACSIEKRLDKYCPLCIQDNSVETTITYRDTTIVIPGETIYLQDTLYCDSLGNVLSKLNTIIKDKEGRLIRLQTTLQNNVYTSRVHVDTIYRTLKGNNIYHTKVITKTLKPLKIKYTPSWMIFLSYTGGIFLLILLIYVLIKILSKKLI